MNNRKYNPRMQVINGVLRTGGAILGIHGYLQGRIMALRENKIILLGRDPKTCDLIIQDDGISRTHCGICYNSGEETYTIYDYSTNGVFPANMPRMNKGDALVVPRGTHLYLGDARNEILLC